MAFLDRELYLPKQWTEDQACCREAGIPEAVGFATKYQLARCMLRSRSPACVVDGRRGLRAGSAAAALAGGVRGSLCARHPCQEQHWVASAEGIQAARVDELARTLAPAAWQRISAGAGAKGERLYGWAFLPAQQQGEAVPLRGLLVRRSLEDAEDRAYHIVFAPRGAMLEELVRVAPGGAG